MPLRNLCRSAACKHLLDDNHLRFIEASTQQQVTNHVPPPRFHMADCQPKRNSSSRYASLAVL